jgi:hypothetical protein
MDPARDVFETTTLGKQRKDLKALATSRKPTVDGAGCPCDQACVASFHQEGCLSRRHPSSMTTVGCCLSYRADPSRRALLPKGASHVYPNNYQFLRISLSYVNEHCISCYAIARTSEVVN